MAVSRGDVVYQKGQSDDSDIWDDTALIKAYDKSITSFKTKLKNGATTTTCENYKVGGETKSVNKRAKTRRRRKRNSASPTDKWWPGDLCQAVWSEDGVVYNAVIKSVDASAGTCIVIFTGYGNEDEMLLDDLLPPAESAGGESDTAVSCDADAPSWPDKESAHSADDSEMPNNQKSGHGARKKGHKQRQSVPPGAFPPPPLCHPPPSPGFPPYLNVWGGFPSPPPHLSAPPLPMIPPPPLPPTIACPDDDDEALGSMLMAWYMSGYHTGYYLGLKQGKKDSMVGRGPRHK